MPGPAVVFVLMFGFLLPGVSGDTHCQRYDCTIQSKNSSLCSAVILLNQTNTHTCTAEHKLEPDLDKLSCVFDKLKKAFGQSDGHTFQRRIGCEVKEHSKSSVPVRYCTHEYDYDGRSLISYDWISRKWSPSVTEWNAVLGAIPDINPDRDCEVCLDCLKNNSQNNGNYFPHQDGSSAGVIVGVTVGVTVGVIVVALLLCGIYWLVKKRGICGQEDSDPQTAVVGGGVGVPLMSGLPTQAGGTSNGQPEVANGHIPAQEDTTAIVLTSAV